MGDGVMEQAIYGARTPAATGVSGARPAFSTTGCRPRSASARTSANGRPAWLVPAACSRSLSATAASPSSRPPTRATTPDRLGVSPARFCRPTCTTVSAAILSPLRISFLPIGRRAANCRPWSGPPGPPPARTVEEVQKVLNVPHSATLLGGVQALLEGRPAGLRAPGARPAPDPRAVGLAADQPPRRPVAGHLRLRQRQRLHVLVVPRAAGPAFEGYITRSRPATTPRALTSCGCKPPSRRGDQRSMDALFAGRSAAADDSARLRSPAAPWPS